MDKFTAPLQESILSLLATNNEQGRIAASLIEASSFDEGYHEFASRVIAYHRTHGQAPGKAHLDDLVDDILDNPKHKQRAQMLRIIEGVLAQADELNPDYLISRITDFEKRQRLKGAISKAIDRYDQGGESLTEDVESILTKALRAPSNSIDAGVFLNEKNKTLSFLDKIGAAFSTGIPEFDRHNIGPSYGQILLMLAPKGAGKTFWCVDLAKRCLLNRAKVVHYTLENPLDQITGRYYQSFFAIPQDREAISLTRLELDKLGRLSGVTRKKHRPRIALDDPKIRAMLGKRIDDWSITLGNLCVKEFPSGSLSIPHIDAHLDYLEMAHKFIPHVIVLDYPDLMQIKGDDKRIAIGDNFVQLRGLLQRRKLCGIFPTQGNRLSLEAASVKTNMVSEDVTKLFTSDMILVYSQTKEEAAMGLARLTVANNRNGKDKFTVIISQNYSTGQFVVDSGRMGNNYEDLLKQAMGQKIGDDE